MKRIFESEDAEEAVKEYILFGSREIQTLSGAICRGSSVNNTRHLNRPPQFHRSEVLVLNASMAQSLSDVRSLRKRVAVTSIRDV